MTDQIEALIAEARDPKWRPHLTEPAGEVWVRLADALSAAHTVIEEAKSVLAWQPGHDGSDSERVEFDYYHRAQLADEAFAILSKYQSGEEDGR